MDKEQVDALIGQIGQIILDDAELVGNEWDTAAFVAVLAKPNSVFGFRYLGTQVYPTTPVTLELLALLEELQVATSDGIHAPWGACLVMIDGATLDYEIDFEYENPERWRLTPSNYKTLPLLLQSHFSP